MHLFEPLTQRDITFRNRIGVSPMCQYSSENGYATDWHLVHLGSRASGGAGVVFTEAAAVEDVGRISANDLGIYMDGHIEKLHQVTSFIKGQGAVPGIQLAHAGRKASTARPWDGGEPVSVQAGGWKPVGPSAIPFSEEYTTPHELTVDEISRIVKAFRDAAVRTLQAGFEVIELHAAHGYLLHEFLSPLSNKRTDSYGGSFQNRTSIIIEAIDAIREVWPDKLPLWVRISTTDWTEGGWDVSQSVELSAMMKSHGVDLVDCSSGGNVASASIPVGSGYQVEAAARIRKEAAVPTAAVGMITSPAQADTIVRTGQADFVLIARELLRNPYWPLMAAQQLHIKTSPVPKQYQRAW